MNQIINGDALTELRKLSDESVQMCITSPPYWNLRNYSVDGQLGLEKTPEEFVKNLVEIFQEVKRVLKNNGTLWLNLGDSYLPNKNLTGIPWRVAFALQANGWYLRSDIIWAKPNAMPESITDRPTKSHEYIFLLTKNKNYFYDADAIREPVAEVSIKRLDRAVSNKNKWLDGPDGQTKHTMNQPRPNRNTKIPAETCESFGSPRARYKRYEKSNAPHEFRGADHLVSPFDAEKGRNKRTVWTIPTQSFSGAHFAVFPEKIPELCIKAGSKECDIILDPFFGSGTTGLVAKKAGRKFIGIELSEKYCKIADERLKQSVMEF